MLCHRSLGRGGSLYLSGIPGTGKTSAVRQAITDLKETKVGK